MASRRPDLLAARPTPAAGRTPAGAITSSSVLAADTAPPRLREGTELIGASRASGRREIPCLVRRADGRMVELSPLLFAVASTLDGRRGLPEIAAEVSATTGRPVSAGNVAYLLDHKLRPLRILAGGDDDPVVQGAPLLGLQVRSAVLPPRAVRVLTTGLRPLFAPLAVVVVLAAFIGVDAWILLEHRPGDVLADVSSRPGMILATAGLMVAAGAFHELGHATASRYGGAAPGAIGVGVYLLWPVFYNDLNDAYRLDRRGRLRADLGGIYFNAVFVLGLAAAYAATGWAPLLGVAAIQHLLILQQLLPFARLDGYYIASDLAGVPDLFGAIRPSLVSLLPGRVDPRARVLTRRARRIATAWALATVPALGLAVVLLVRSAPRIVAAAWEASSVQAGAVLAGLRAGEPLDALLGGLQLAIVVLPFAGLGVPVVRALLGHRRMS